MTSALSFLVTYKNANLFIFSLVSIPNANDIEYLVLISAHSNAICDTARNVAHKTVCPYQKMLHATFSPEENDEDVHMVKRTSTFPTN